jgi:hypothetical protein
MTAIPILAGRFYGNRSDRNIFIKTETVNMVERNIWTVACYNECISAIKSHGYVKANKGFMRI